MLKHSSARRSATARLARILCLATALAGACGVNSRAVPIGVTSQTESRVNIALRDLQRYKSSRSLDDLRSTLYGLQAAIDVRTLTPENFLDSRRSLVDGWAQLLREIEMSYDPKFDPSKHFWCPEPERQPDGTQPMPCANPSVIQNPQARATYAVELKAYRLRLSQAAHYQEVHNLDEGAMVTLSMGLDVLRKLAPSGVGSDFVTLDSIVRRAGLSSVRRSEIDAMFYGEPTTRSQ